MANIKVKDLTDTQTVNLDDEVMVLTDENTNLVQNITVENLLTSVLSTDADNVLQQDNSGKLFVENPENITGELTDLTTTSKTNLVSAINEVDGDITAEATTRQNADNNLQSQIDAITAASDVTDIVGTYAELQAYDTTDLPTNSIIKVLQDESQNDETTYYRWVITGGVGAWVLVGEEGPYYTISQADNKFATKETMGDLNNLATSDKTSIVNAMNELASVLDPTQTADYIKNSKAIYSGEVSENALILPQIKEMAHSTFDLSKFTVAGSPNITDDGIASGFSDSNYIKVTGLDANVNKVQLRLKTPSSLSATIFCTFINSNSNTVYYIDITAGGNLYFRYYNGTSFSNALIVSPCNVNTIYDIEIVIDGTNITVIANGNTTATVNDFSPRGNITNIVICNDTFTGSFDLKQFSITAVDGVEVFSGNKTGIDTIKPDDYTVVGTPTISADGVASGFDTNVVIKSSTFNITSGQTFSFKGNFNPVNYSGSFGTVFTLYDTVNSVDKIQFGLDTNINKLMFRYPASATTASAAVNSLGNIAYNQNHYYEIKYDGTKLYLYVDDTSIYNVDIPTAYWASTYRIELGNDSNRGLAQPLNGSIDLNLVETIINGDLKYQPCLKIPYTESKTGSKIVNAIYRDRVVDMYEQKGYAPYYTLSDTDFTLPQGELYGYLEKRARDIAHPVAQPFYRFSDEINEDEVRLEGAEVDKGLYLAIEQDPYLSALCTAGSTSDKICLPDFRNRVIYGDVASGYVEPELPNITGTTWGEISTDLIWTEVTGAFYKTNTTGKRGHSNADDDNTNIGFDASLSSSIYKNNATVKTAGVKARWLARWK